MSLPFPASPFYFKPLELSYSDDTTLDRYYASAAAGRGTFPSSPTSSPTSIMIFRDVVVVTEAQEDDGTSPSCWEDSSAGRCPLAGGGLLQRANPICDDHGTTTTRFGPMDGRFEDDDHDWSCRERRVAVSPTLMVLDYQYASEESLLLMPQAVDDDDDEGRPDGEEVEGGESEYCGLSPIKLDYSRFFVDADHPHSSSLTPPSWTTSELRPTAALFSSSPGVPLSSSLLSSDDDADDDDDELECNDDEDDFSLSSQEAHSMMEDDNDDLGVDDPAAVWEAGIPLRGESWSSPSSSPPPPPTLPSPSSAAPYPHPVPAGRCHSPSAAPVHPKRLPSL